MNLTMGKMKMKTTNVSHFPVMKAKCATCPFGTPGYPELAAQITEQILTDASQICHSSGWPEGTHLCRGARDIQLRLFTSMGIITAPTDEAWNTKVEEMGL